MDTDRVRRIAAENRARVDQAAQEQDRENDRARKVRQVFDEQVADRWRQLTEEIRQFVDTYNQPDRRLDLQSPPNRVVVRSTTALGAELSVDLNRIGGTVSAWISTGAGSDRQLPLKLVVDGGRLHWFFEDRQSDEEQIAMAMLEQFTRRFP